MHTPQNPSREQARGIGLLKDFLDTLRNSGAKPVDLARKFLQLFERGELKKSVKDAVASTSIMDQRDLMLLQQVFMPNNANKAYTALLEVGLSDKQINQFLESAKTPRLILDKLLNALRAANYNKQNAIASFAQLFEMTGNKMTLKQDVKSYLESKQSGLFTDNDKQRLRQLSDSLGDYNLDKKQLTGFEEAAGFKFQLDMQQNKKPAQSGPFFKGNKVHRGDLQVGGHRQGKGERSSRDSDTASTDSELDKEFNDLFGGPGKKGSSSG